MKESTETGGALGIGLAIVTVLSNWKFFQSLGDKLGDAAILWVEQRPKRQLARRVPDEKQQALVLSTERAEAETLVLMLKNEYEADRVTLVEYDCPKDASQPTLATCLHESHEQTVASVRWQIQKLPLQQQVWAWVQSIHALPSRCLFVSDIELLDNPAVRSQLLASGVRAGYYQSLPATAGHCGALLAISWAQPMELAPDDLAGLQWSGRLLGSMQRTSWAFQLEAA